MIYAQLYIASGFIFHLLKYLHLAFYGQPMKLPTGFAGACLVLIAITVDAWVYWKAGAFSLLLAWAL